MKNKMLNLLRSKLLAVGVAIGVFALVFLAAATANAACTLTSVDEPDNLEYIGGASYAVTISVAPGDTCGTNGAVFTGYYLFDSDNDGDFTDEGAFQSFGSTSPLVDSPSYVIDWDTTARTAASNTRYMIRVIAGGGASPITLTPAITYGIDHTAPVKDGIITKDNNKNGHIDAIELTFTEDYGMDTSRTSTSGFTVAGYTVGATGTWNEQTFRIPLTELGTGDTDAIPNVAYTNPGDATGLQDLAGNDLANFGAIAASDGAAPAPVSAVFQDNDNNGTVDRIVVTLSEPVADDDYTFDAADWTFANNTDLNFSDPTSITTPGGGETLTLGVTADAGETGITTTPQIVYTDNGGNLSDGTVAQAGPTVAANITDGAAPVPLSATYLDIDHNGTIDRADVTWSEAPTLALFEAGDHVFNAESALGAITPTGAVVDGNDLQIDITPANPNITGSAAALTYKYTEQGTPGGITQGANAAVTSGAITVADNAAPVPLSATYLDNDGDGTIDRADVTWSGEITNTLSLFEAGDHVFSSDSSFGAIAPQPGISFVGNVLQIPVAPAYANVTGSAVSPTYTYTDAVTTGSVNDGLGHNAVNSGAVTIVDDADPIIVSATTLTTITFQLNFSEIIKESTLANGDLEYHNAASGGDTAIADADLADGDASTYVVTVAHAFAANETTAEVHFNVVGVIDDLATPANSNAQTADVLIADGIAPTVVSATTADSDSNGQIDQLIVVYSEAVDDDNYNAVVAEGYAMPGTGANTGTATITYNLTPLVTPDTDATPDLTWTEANAADLNGVLFDDTGAPATATDGAGPAIIRARSISTTEVEVTFSEHISDASVVAGDITFNFADGNADGVASHFDTGATANDEIGIFTIKVGGAIAASENNGTVKFTAATVISDSVAVFNTQTTTVTVLDSIAPTITARDTKDLDSDGQIDAIKITFSEAIDDDTVTVANFALAAPYDTNEKSFSATNDCAGGATRSVDSNYICLAFVEEGLTAGDTAAIPTVKYTSGTLTDAHTGLMATEGAPVASTDTAGPAIMSAITTNVNTVTVTFSEGVTGASAAITDFLFSDFATVGANLAPTGLGDNDGDATLTMTLADAIGGTETGHVNIVNAGDVADSGGNLSAQVAKVDVTDGIVPTITARQTKDLNHNGHIDAIKITFSEAIDDDTVTVANFALAAPYDTNEKNFSATNDCAGGATRSPDSNYICLAFVEEDIAAGDTDAVPTIQYATGGFTDVHGVALADDGPTISTDTAAPAPLTATYLDIDNNGTIDRADVAWSEAPTLALFEAGDHVFNSDSAFGAITPTGAVVNGDDLRIDITPANTGVTGSSAALTYTYTEQETAGGVTQGANTAVTSSAVTVADNAAPVPLSGTYWDINNNGTIDHAYITFSSENVQSVGFEAGDHIFNAGSAFGAVTPSTASFVGNVLQITVAPANSNITGSLAALTYAYTAQGAGGDVDDSLGHNAITSAAITLVDKAAPVPLSGVYKDINNNGTIDRVDITFSGEIANTLTTFEAGDHVFNSGSAFGAVTPTGAIFAGNDLRINVTPANSGVTGSTAALTYTYTDAGAAAGSVNDALTNNAVTSAAITQVDTAGPVVIKVFSSGTNKIKLRWSESVATASSETESNYTLQTGAVNPIIATKNPTVAPTGNNYVELTFGTYVFPGVHTLDVTGINDLIPIGMVAQSSLTIEGGATVSGISVQPNQTAGATVTLTGLATAVSPATVHAVSYCMVDKNALKLGCTDLNDTSTWTELDASDGTFNAVAEAFEGNNINIATLADGTVTIHIAAQDSNGVFGAENTVTFTNSAGGDTTSPTLSTITPSTVQVTGSVAPVVFAFADETAFNGTAANNVIEFKMDGATVAGVPVVSEAGTVLTITYTNAALGVGVHNFNVKIKDAAGNETTASAAVNVIAAASAPTVTQTPADDTANVAIDVLPTVTFSDDMDLSTVNPTTVQVRNYTDDVQVEAFITQDATDPHKFIIDPNIVYGGHYYIWVSGAKDSAGDLVTPYITKANQEFTYVGYVATPPTVDSFMPGADQEIGVNVGPGNNNVSVTFNTMMWENSLTTATVKLWKVVVGGDTEVALDSIVIQNGDGKTIAQLIPSNDLEYNKEYYITVSTGAQDYDHGDHLAALYTSGTFHTILQPTGSLTVHSISQVRYWGVQNGGYDNGWEWVMRATIPTNANHFHLKFADWISASGSATLPAGDNMKYWSEQITAGLIGSESNPVLITDANTFPADIALNTDDSSDPGMQTNIHIQVQIPSGQAGGSYSTSYGLEN